MMVLDPIQTLAFAGAALFLGYGLRHVAPWLQRYNLPAPVIGGLTVALAIAVARGWGVSLVDFDDALQKPLMSAFFTSIGFRVSVALLRRGGGAAMLLLVLSTLGAVLQNVVGVGMALALGQPALFGVLCGSVTLTGGPATGLAFAPMFSEAGVPAAEAVAIAAATLGIVAGGLFGAPLATLIIERRRSAAPPTSVAASVIPPSVEAPDPGECDAEAQSYVVHKSVVVLLVGMWIGSWLSAWLSEHVMTLPLYMGGMIAAAVIRNIDDVTGWFALSHRTLDRIGQVSLSFFLVMALMSLELWRLAAVALPMIAILTVQVAIMIVYSVWPVFYRMGRDYDAAVASGGFYGYMIGTTANAMANMDSLVNRYGPAPVAYLVVPIVGAFFLDFTNAILIQTCINTFS